MSALHPASASDITWSGASNNNFNTTTNYTPAPIDAADFINHDLIFETPVSANLAMSANLNIGSLTVKQGATNFILGRGSNRSLTFKGTGITVENNTDAVINPDIAFHSTNPSQELIFNVGVGSNLHLGGNLNPNSRRFEKEGSGTLIIGRGSNVVRKFPTAQGSFGFNEGTIEIQSTARIGWETGQTATPQELEISLGTSTQSALLKGSGNLDGQLITAGIDRSAIEPDGDFTIHTLNAAAGATFNYTLGDGLLKGNGVFTSSTAAGGIAFNFEGGETNTTYTLLQYSEIAGMEIGDFSILSSGYELNTSFGTGGWLIDSANGTLQVQFSAIPEPGVGSLAVISLATAGFARLFGKRGK